MLFRISSQEKVNFTKNLSVMLRSGITINEALTALSEQSSKKFAKTILRIRDSIEKGTSLSDAFEKEEQQFGMVFVSLVRAGEESGTLQQNLVFLSEWFERNNDLRREVNSAMLYPKLVLSAAFLLGAGLAVFILPKLIPLFNQLDVELPLVTKILIAISTFLGEKWLITSIGTAALVALFILINRIAFVRRLFHYLYIKMPFVGNILTNYQLALITQLFGTLIKSGLSILESLSIVEEAATNIHYKESLQAMSEHTKRGTSLGKSIKEYPELYPAVFNNIVAVGEKSGTLADSFEYLSEYYTKEVNSETKRLPTIIEPLLLILIAVVVGFVALAIILPIYKLTGSITT